MKFVPIIPALIALALAMPASAGVGKVSSPLVTEGVAEVKYSGVRYGDDGKEANNKQSHGLELKYGLTERLMLGIEAGSERQSSEDHHLSIYGLEGQYELTQQGQWWLDSAIKAEYAHAADKGDVDEAGFFLLLAKRTGQTNIVVNLGLEKQLLNADADALDVSSKLLVSHTITPYFVPGIEWHADYGTLHDLNSANEHYIGPSVSGDVLTEGDTKLQYGVGYFWGITNHSADNATRLQLTYKVAF